MIKMHNLRRTAADVKAESPKGKTDRDAPSSYVAPEDDGARFDLEHHHLMKMGLGADLKSGDTGEFHGRYTVERSESRSTPEGEKHSATIRFHKGGIEADEGGERDAKARGNLRSELESIHGKSEEAAEKKREAATAKRSPAGEKA